MEEEVAPVDLPQAHVVDLLGGESVEQGAGGLDGVVRQPDRAGEHVGRPAGEGGQGGLGARQAVGGLVQRAVAAERDHHDVVAVARPLGEAGAWFRRFVSATVTSWSADNAFWITTLPRAVTDEA